MAQTRADVVAANLIVGDPEACWTWRQVTVNRYTNALDPVTGRTTTASRLVLMVYAGDPPTPKHHAMHSCDNPKCVNPAHLRWGTASENTKDKLTKGRQYKRPLCDIDGCDKPINAKGLCHKHYWRQRNLGETFDNTKRINVGEKAGHARFTTEDVTLMRAIYDNGFSVSHIARVFEAPYITVYGIVTRKSWKHLP